MCLLRAFVKLISFCVSEDVGRAAQTLVNAIENDPLEIYMRDTPVRFSLISAVSPICLTWSSLLQDARHPRLYKRIQRLQYAIALSQFVERKWGLTVDNGRAIVCG